ncbi:MAG TPA: hypothetical protein VGD60_00995 [Candidatus Acidoferrales bacterium]
MDSALTEWGISTQSPIVLTCVTLKQTPPVNTASARITFRTIKKSLYGGFTDKKTRYGTYKIADAEKAFLDWIYFRRRDRLPAAFDEFEFRHLSRSKLLAYAKNYPALLQQTLYPALLEYPFAA